MIVSLKEQNAFLPSFKPLSVKLFGDIPSRNSTKHFCFYNGPDFKKFTTLATAGPASTVQVQDGKENPRRCYLMTPCSLLMSGRQFHALSVNSKFPRTMCRQETWPFLNAVKENLEFILEQLHCASVSNISLECHKGSCAVPPTA